MALLIKTTKHPQSRLRLSLVIFNMKMAPIVILKTLATFGLFLVFFVFFGYSSISKFMLRDTVMVTRTKPNQDGLPAPGIMVCPVSEFGRGWKWNETCGEEEDATGVQDCISDNAYKLDETIDRTGMMRNNDPSDLRQINSNSWSPSFVNTWHGVCYTLYHRKLMKSSDILFVSFGSQPNNIKVFLYDPKFFTLKSDSFFVPFIALNHPNLLISLHRTSTLKMNRPPEFECNPDEKYNYNQCVRNSLALQIGCNYPWDMTDTQNTYQTCNKTSQLQQYWKFRYPKMFYAKPKELTDLTGCKIPCHYTKFSIVGTPEEYNQNNYSYIELSYTSTDVTSSQEVLLYPFDSLVSEFGGALGQLVYLPG